MIVIVYAFIFSSFSASSVKFISWSYSHHSSNFSNFFLLNKCVKDQIYSGKSSKFILSGSFLILLLSCVVVSVAYVLLVLNSISQYFILQLPEHLMNFIVPFFQLTSGLCLTSQSYPKTYSYYLDILPQLLATFCVCWFQSLETLSWLPLHSLFHPHWTLQMRNWLASFEFSCPWLIICQSPYVCI